MLGHCLINLESLKQTEILYQLYDPFMQVFNEIPWAFINILRSDLSRVITTYLSNLKIFRLLIQLIGLFSISFNLAFTRWGVALSLSSQLLPSSLNWFLIKGGGVKVMNLRNNKDKQELFDCQATERPSLTQTTRHSPKRKKSYKIK